MSIPVTESDLTMLILEQGGAIQEIDVPVIAFTEEDYSMYIRDYCGKLEVRLDGLSDDLAQIEHNYLTDGYG